MRYGWLLSVGVMAAASPGLACDDAAPLPAPPSDAIAPDPGPPMTGAERDAFRVAVQKCWIVDPGSQAGRVTVTVAFELGRDGKVVGDVRLLDHGDGSAEAAEGAFEAARSAVLRCQGSLPLPPEKYEQWRLVEMTFNAERMTVR